MVSTFALLQVWIGEDMSLPSLSLAQAAAVVSQFGLLHEVITQDGWRADPASCPELTFQHLTYDTRTIPEHTHNNTAADNTLLFIKGNFNPQYLRGLDQHGLAGYVAEQDYSAYTSVPGIIVSDVYAAMARIAAEFYGHPEQELTIIGLTGTKGKTTTAFLTFALLQQLTHHHTALLSSQSSCIDGTTLVPSHLTTPESLDSYRMMRQAREHGITHMVMEISSQAYKIGRVTGIHFTSAAFLNISPDHISPIEHPTFENYLYCKRQIIQHTDQIVINADCDYLQLLLDDAISRHLPITLCTLDTGTSEVHSGVQIASCDDCLTQLHTDVADDHRHFVTTIVQRNHSAASQTAVWTSPQLQLMLPGVFNIANAQVALALVHSLGLTADQNALEALESTRVPGRMERIETKLGITCIIDYAHNYLSVHSLIAEAEQEFIDPYIIVLSGSTGGKALDRREGIIKACQEGARAVVLTTDDCNFEDPIDIAREMQSYITDPSLVSTIIVDREQAIYATLRAAAALRDGATVRAQSVVDEDNPSDVLHLPALDRPDQPIVVLCAGKGAETHQIIQGKATAYIGDSAAVVRALCAL